MTNYTIIQKHDHTGFCVAIVGSNGTRQTVLGFKTQADARAWIAWDKWLSTTESSDPVRTKG